MPALLRSLGRIGVSQPATSEGFTPLTYPPNLKVVG